MVILGGPLLEPGMLRMMVRKGTRPHGFTRQILRPTSHVKNQQDQQLTSTESSKTEQNPQPRHKQKSKDRDNSLILTYLWKRRERSIDLKVTLPNVSTRENGRR
jgi:hypothetical protein